MGPSSQCLSTATGSATGVYVYTPPCCALQKVLRNSVAKCCAWLQKCCKSVARGAQQGCCADLAMGWRHNPQWSPGPKAGERNRERKCYGSVAPSRKKGRPRTTERAGGREMRDAEMANQLRLELVQKLKEVWRYPKEYCWNNVVDNLIAKVRAYLIDEDAELPIPPKFLFTREYQRAQQDMLAAGWRKVREEK